MLVCISKISLFLFIPSVACIQCKEWELFKSGSHNCVGDTCVTLFQVEEAVLKGCITNISIANGCYEESPGSLACYCQTDNCNADTTNHTELIALPTASCYNPSAPTQCDRTRCLYTTDRDGKTCLSFGKPTAVHEMYTNTIFYDQSAWMDCMFNTHDCNSIMAQCDNTECMNLAKAAGTQNFTSSKPQVTCYVHQFLLERRNGEMYEHNCTGDFCYMSQYGPNLFTRGCLSIIDDSLAQREVEMGTFGYLSLNYYLCDEDLCNLEDVGVRKMEVVEQRVQRDSDSIQLEATVETIGIEATTKQASVWKWNFFALAAVISAKYSQY